MEADIAGIIVAVSGLVSAISVLISKFYHDRKFQAVADDIKATDDWVAEIEAKGTLKAGIQAVEELSPEAKAFIDAKAEEINKLKAELAEKKAAVEKLTAAVDAAGAPKLSEAGIP